MFQQVFRFLLPFVLSFGVITCPKIWEGDSSSTGSDDGSPSAPVDTDVDDCGSVPAALKQILLQNGYSETAAAGIMGNIKGESGYRINVIEGGRLITDPNWKAYENGHKTFSGGFGLVQWTSAGRVQNLQNYADSIGKSVTSIEAQGGFLVRELQSYNMTPSRLNSMSLSEVTWLILRDYETPMSVICWSGHSNSNYRCSGNSASPRNISYSTLNGNRSTYSRAFSSFSARFSYAQSAQSVTTETCSGDSGSTGGDSSGSDTSGGGTTSGGDTAVDSGGAVGRTNTSGYYLQSSYPNTVWRRQNDGSGWSIKASGCSLIAIANAMKFLNKTPNNPATIAEYAKTVVCGQNCTGWGSSNMSIDLLARHYNLNLSTLWSSESTSSSTKLQKVRQSLANGRPVLLRGAHGGAYDCTNRSNISAGHCVFSRNGHFIVIIGVTADNKVVVANPANGAAGAYNASNALQFANKAASVR